MCVRVCFFLVCKLYIKLLCFFLIFFLANGNVSQIDGLILLQQLTNGLFYLRAQQNEMNFMVNAQRMNHLSEQFLVNCCLPATFNLHST